MFLKREIANNNNLLIYFLKVSFKFFGYLSAVKFSLQVLSSLTVDFNKIDLLDIIVGYHKNPFYVPEFVPNLINL